MNKQNLKNTFLLTLTVGLLLTSLGTQYSRADTGDAILGGLIGATVGAVIGYEISQALDDEDKHLSDDAYNRYLSSDDDQEVEWRSQRGENRGSFTPRRRYFNSSGFACRTFFQDYWINGQYFHNEGRVCQNSRGQWVRVQQEEVVQEPHVRIYTGIRDPRFYGGYQPRFRPEYPRYYGEERHERHHRSHAWRAW